MSGAAATARRAAAVGLAAIPAALAGGSWPVLAALVVATLMVVAAVCWAIADPGRARRLAALIRACRQPALPATARGRPAATGRRQ